MRHNHYKAILHKKTANSESAVYFSFGQTILNIDLCRPSAIYSCNQYLFARNTQH